MKNNKELILTYLKKLKPKLLKEGITELGIFGSYAKGNNDICSDIDIFIKTSDSFCRKYLGFKALIFLDNLREHLQKHFKTSIDLCDIASFSEEKKNKVLEGAIYV